MCMAPRTPTAPAPRNLLQVYGRTLDLDKEADRIDYRNLQRLEAEGRIDRWGRELAPPPASPTGSGGSAEGDDTAPQAGSVAQKAEAPREVTRGEQEARRRTASQARVAGRTPTIAAGSRLGQGNSAKKTLLGG